MAPKSLSRRRNEILREIDILSKEALKHVEHLQDYVHCYLDLVVTGSAVHKKTSCEAQDFIARLMTLKARSHPQKSGHFPCV